MFRGRLQLQFTAHSIAVLYKHYIHCIFRICALVRKQSQSVRPTSAHVRVVPGFRFEMIPPTEGILQSQVMQLASLVTLIFFPTRKHALPTKLDQPIPVAQ